MELSSTRGGHQSQIFLPRAVRLPKIVFRNRAAPSRPYLQFGPGIRSDSYILPHPDVEVLREEAGEIRLEVATLFRLDTTMVKVPVRVR